MFRAWLPWVIIIAAVSFSFAEYGFYFPELPDNVASHFNAQGRPDDSMPKGKFVGVMAGTWALLILIMAVLVPLVAYLPGSLINLPHKDYWLAPERSKASRRSLSLRLTWISAGTVLFMANLFHEILVTNLPPNPPFAVWTPLIIYVVFIAIVCGELIWHFSCMPSDPAT